ncbi:MAG: primosomal protein N' [Actinomycetales bacterium]|nr:primosomal protein N' [Actinomycetales bacterium]
MTESEPSLFPTPRRRVKAAVPLADQLPIAKVLLDSSLPHLDRLFDYSVPKKFADTALPGVRVRVRFAGKLVDGFITERVSESDHPGTLLPLSVTSPEPVLTAELLALVSEVAKRNAGTLWDVVRTAIPTRHARAEAASLPPADFVTAISPDLLTQYSGGQALITRTLAGQTPRAIMPTGSDNPATLLTEYATAIAAAKQSIIILVPDRAALNRVLTELAKSGVPKTAIASIAADDGPELRYRNWLAALRGTARIVVGTRSAIFVPVPELAAICIWDDWNETYLEPHAPYWHAREVAVLRSANQNTALVILGSSPSVDAVALMPWLAVVSRTPEQMRKGMAKVRSSFEEPYVAGGAGQRIPQLAFKAITNALKSGPVLVLVPRTGYSPRLACQKCRNLAVCTKCSGPLIQTDRSSAPSCRLCGHLEANWQCPHCQESNLRATAIGSLRTAEELGRAFPGIPVRSSSADHIVREIDSRPSIVVATPGAAPIAASGYQAAIFLDGNILLSRPDLRATEDTFAKWMECASLVRPGGEIVVVAEPGHPAVQGLIRHDPVGFAQRELAERASVDLPPAKRIAVLAGQKADIDDLLAIAELPDGVTIRGPVPTAAGVRLILAINRSNSVDLATALKSASVIRSARKRGEPVNIRFDPYDL